MKSTKCLYAALFTTIGLSIIEMLGPGLKSENLKALENAEQTLEELRTRKKVVGDIPYFLSYKNRTMVDSLNEMALTEDPKKMRLYSKMIESVKEDIREFKKTPSVIKYGERRTAISVASTTSTLGLLPLALCYFFCERKKLKK